MICNVAKWDRVVRALLAIVLISFALMFINTTPPKIVVLGTATLLLLSAWFGVCYIYKMLGISSLKVKPRAP